MKGIIKPKNRRIVFEFCIHSFYSANNNRFGTDINTEQETDGTNGYIYDQGNGIDARNSFTNNCISRFSSSIPIYYYANQTDINYWLPTCGYLRVIPKTGSNSNCVPDGCGGSGN